MECKLFWLRFHRMVLWFFLFFAMVLSVASMFSCEFLKFDMFLAPLPYDLLVLFRTDVFHVGLWRYNPGDGCRSISSQRLETKFEFKVARWGVCLAIALAIVALIVVWMEFLCCRFCCARFIASASCVLACLCQACSLFLLSSPLCRPDRWEAEDEIEAYTFPCKLDTGGFLSIASSSMYLLSSMMVCATAKPEPVCVTMKEDEDDPCICPRFRGQKCDQDDEAVVVTEFKREDLVKCDEVEIVDNDMFFEARSRRSVSFELRPLDDESIEDGLNEESDAKNDAFVNS